MYVGMYIGWAFGYITKWRRCTLDGCISHDRHLKHVVIAHVGSRGLLYSRLLATRATEGTWRRFLKGTSRTEQKLPLGGFLPSRYTQQCVCGFENVTRAPHQLVLSRKWVKLTYGHVTSLQAFLLFIPLIKAM